MLEFNGYVVVEIDEDGDITTTIGVPDFEDWIDHEGGELDMWTLLQDIQEVGAGTVQCSSSLNEFGLDPADESIFEQIQE